ncbi:AAA family ATPase, partial [Acinetobacter sp. 163]|nr:AAA family ATPase [Acinetobacter sp. 163]
MNRTTVHINLQKTKILVPVWAEPEIVGGNMLAHLHVKNLALIEEIEVEFGPGLNILTGETGAGKSILLGS